MDAGEHIGQPSGRDGRPMAADVVYQFTDRLFRASAVGDVFDAALEAIVAALNCDRASVLLFDHKDVMRFVAWKGLSAGYRAAVDGHTPWRARQRDAEPIWIEDILTSDQSETLKAAIAEEGIRGLGMIPLIANGGVVGKFMAYYDRPRALSRPEAEAALTIARQLGFFVEKRLIDEARRAAERSLAESESRLRLALEAARMAAWQHHGASGEVTGSAELNRLLGLPSGVDITFDLIRERIQPEDRQALYRSVAPILARGDRYFEAEFRFNRPDGEQRWFLVRGETVIAENGLALDTTGVLLDITDRKAAEAALAEREEQLKAALAAGKLAMFDFDHLAGRMEPSPTMNALYGFPPDHPLTIGDIRRRYHPDDVEEILARAMADAADPDLVNFTWVLHLLLPDGQARWIEALGEYLRDADGKPVRSRGVARDITERKRWEEHQRLLLNELNHRVKNTLAVVQGLAQQSFRLGEPLEKSRAAFEARLIALSAAHNILTQQNWQATSVRQIMDASLAATLGERAARVSWEGDEFQLPPQTAVSVALAVHELSTNAVKYGALSNDAGTIDVRWSVSQVDDRPRFSLCWREDGGPPVVAPARRGFGSRMIERGLANELGGEARLDFRPEGLVCVINAPLRAAEGA